MAAGTLHISISAEPLFSLGGLTVSNSMLTSVVVSGLIIAFALWVRLTLKSTNRPTGLQNVAEWIVEALHNFVAGVTNNHKKTELFFPIIASFFLFILCNNWFGLLPGVGTIGFYEEAKHVEVTEHVAPTEGDHEKIAKVEEHAEEKIFVPYFRAGTADLNTTIALGLTSVILIQTFGFMHIKFAYLQKFLNFSSPINFFIGILEIVSEVSRVISFAFRLFGNIFAGEVLLAVIGFLVPVIAPMPFYALELFVGFIQALVFAMLSVVLFNMATIGHDDHN